MIMAILLLMWNSPLQELSSSVMVSSPILPACGTLSHLVFFRLHSTFLPTYLPKVRSITSQSRDTLPPPPPMPYVPKAANCNNPDPNDPPVPRCHSPAFCLLLLEVPEPWQTPRHRKGTKGFQGGWGGWLFCYDVTNILWRFSPDREGDVTNVLWR